MIELLLSRFAFQLRYLHELMAEIPDDRMADQPAPGMNHPAWILGHLACSAEFVPALAGLEKRLPAAWSDLFDPSSRPLADRSVYPLKADLLRALDETHARAAEVARGFTPEQFAAEFPMEPFRFIMPTVGDAVVHILTTHEATHSGQLSAWRRSAGFGPAKFMSFV